MIELGSADAPCIMGCGFKTPYALFLEKSGLVESKDEPDEIMESGKALEGAILGLFVARLTDHSVIWKEQHTMRHEFLRATPDALLLRYDRETDVEHISLVEVKALVNQPPTVPRVRDVVQCLHQRIVADQHFDHQIEHQYLAYFGGLRLVWWEIPSHPDAMWRVLKEEERFLKMVESGTPPPLRAEDASVLHRRWPWSRPETVTLDAPDVLNADLILQQTEVEMETLTRERKRAQAVIEAAMGEAESARLSNGAEYTWRTSPRKGYTVAPGHTRTFKRRKGDGE